MRWSELELQALRRAAYKLAASKPHTAPSQRRSKATEVMAQLVAIRKRSTVAATAKRLAANCAELEPLRELPLMGCEQRVISLAMRADVDADDLANALQVEKDARYQALLGISDHPAARAVIWRVGADSVVAQRLARHMRWGTSRVEKGEVTVPVRRRSIAMALAGVFGMCWGLLLVRHIPDVWNDAGSFEMFCVTQALFLSYLLWPAARGLRQEMRDRDAANSTPRLRVHS